MVIYEMINESRGTPILLRGEMEKQGRRRRQRARRREREREGDRVRASRVLYLIIGRPMRVSETLMTACVRRARPFATSEPSVFNARFQRGRISGRVVNGSAGDRGERHGALENQERPLLLSPSTRVTREAVPPVRLSPKGVKTVARATSTFPTWRICRRTRRTARRFRSMQARASVTAG